VSFGDFVAKVDENRSPPLLMVRPMVHRFEAGADTLDDYLVVRVFSRTLPRPCPD